MADEKDEPIFQPPTDFVVNEDLLDQADDEALEAYVKPIRQEAKERGIFATVLMVLFLGLLIWGGLRESASDKKIALLKTANHELLVTNEQFWLEQRDRPVMTGTPRVSPPKDAPPATVVIGQYTYAVYFTTQDYLHSAQCRCEAFVDLSLKLIWLNKSGKPDDLRESLVHELLHAAKKEGVGMWDNNPHPSSTHTDGDNERTEHRFISPASPVILQILTDNPKLVDWLTDRPAKSSTKSDKITPSQATPKLVWGSQTGYGRTLVLTCPPNQKCEIDGGHWRVKK